MGFFDQIECDIQLQLTKEMVMLMSSSQNEEEKMRRVKSILEKTPSFAELKDSLQNIFSNNNKVKTFSKSL